MSLHLKQVGPNLQVNQAVLIGCLRVWLSTDKRCASAIIINLCGVWGSNGAHDYTELLFNQHHQPQTCLRKSTKHTPSLDTYNEAILPLSKCY